MLSLNNKVCKGFVNNRVKYYSTENPQLILSRYKLERLKQERFGEELEVFKKKYELPIFELYAKASEKKKREIKKLLNREARKNKLEKKWSQVDKNAEEDDILATIDRDSAISFDELMKAKEEKPITFYDFMLGKHPLSNTLRSIKKTTQIAEPTFTGFLYEAIDSEREIPLNDHLANEIPYKYKQSGRQWIYEKGLSKNLLLQAITADLLEHGLNVKEDKRLVQGSLSKIMDDDFTTGLGDDYFPLGGLERPLENTSELADVDTPLFLKYEEIADRRWKKIERNHIDTNDGYNYPFVVETVDFPLLSAMKGRTENVPIDLILRKAILKVYLDNLNLPDPVRNRLIELAGSRYKPKYNMIKLTSRTKPNQSENIANVYSIFRSLISEAWKADLNYVPPEKDQLEPHQQIEVEIEHEQEKERLQSENDPSNFVKSGFTFFKIYEPPIKSHHKRTPKEIINEMLQL